MWEGIFPTRVNPVARAPLRAHPARASQRLRLHCMGKIFRREVGRGFEFHRRNHHIQPSRASRPQDRHRRHRGGPGRPLLSIPSAEAWSRAKPGICGARSVATAGRCLAVPLALTQTEHRQPYPRSAWDALFRGGRYRCHRSGGQRRGAAVLCGLREGIRPPRVPACQSDRRV